MKTRLRPLRENKGFSQKQIADMLYIDQSTYSRYESGYLEIPLDVLFKLCKVYDVSIDYLTCRELTENNKK